MKSPLDAQTSSRNVLESIRLVLVLDLKVPPVVRA